MFLRSTAILAALVLATPTAAQRLTPAETAEVDRLVAATLADTGVPSASVAVARGGEVVFTKAYGKQSERRPANPDPNAPYQIASVSKQFTAAALQLLEDEGKLSLDDKVAKHLPEVSGAGRITLRQLLSHTSGLQDYWPQDYSFKAMEASTTPQAIIDRWAKKPLDFEPGTQWQYSNTGYVVAGRIVEQVSGEPLMAFLQRRIFRPLGMRVLSQDDAVGPGFPQGYHRYALGPVRVERPAARGWLYAAGELAMSAGDLAKWDAARMARRLLPADDWAEQETPVRLADGSSTGYGLGVFIGTRDGRRYVEHGGEAVGFLSENIVFPDQRAAVVVLTNADFSDAQSTIAAGVARIVLPAAPAAEEDSHTVRARRVFDTLRSGALDRSGLTENADYYFNPTAVADYRASLSALGEPSGFELARPARLRGGFVNRNYTVAYPNGRKLRVITYAEQGSNGRYEQFLVQPAS